MSKVIVTESYLQDAADAIREKNSSTDTYTPAEMGDAIRNLPSRSVRTTPISLYLAGAAGYYTDADMTVKTPVVNMDTRSIYISDHAPLGSLVVLCDQPAPISVSGVTLLESNERKGWYVYEVVEEVSSGGSND